VPAAVGLLGARHIIKVVVARQRFEVQVVFADHKVGIPTAVCIPRALIVRQCAARNVTSNVGAEERIGTPATPRFLGGAAFLAVVLVAVKLGTFMLAGVGADIPQALVAAVASQLLEVKVARQRRVLLEAGVVFGTPETVGMCAVRLVE
jgi:hypothetical protein